MEFIGLTCKAMGEMLFTGLWMSNLQKTTLESFYVAGEMVFLELPRWSPFSSFCPTYIL